MPATMVMPMEFRAAAPAPVTSVSGKWPQIGGHAGHQHGAQPHQRGLAHGLRSWSGRVRCSSLANCDDEDAVLRDQADQGDQTDLRVDVQRGGPAVGEERHVRAGHLEEAEHQRAEHGQRHRAQQDDQRIAEAVELGRQHQEDQHQRQDEGGQELAAFDAQLAGFAGVIQLVALGQDLGRFVFEEAQRLIERADGHAADLDGVELLEPVERARAGLLLQRGEGAERHQLAVRPLDVGVLELARR